MTEETVRPEDLKPGDRVRVTLEGVVDDDGEFSAGESPLLGNRWLSMDVLAHATITRLPPPVDPDLLLARKVCAKQFPSEADAYGRGAYDSGGFMGVALAAIKLAKEQS
jgi:hypothetical protein